MNSVLSYPAVPNVLNWRSARGLLCQAGLVLSALVLPAVCHYFALPVYWILPMHWPVLLAGLVYGWRGGLTVGIMVPLASYALSGMPLISSLPYMTLEIAVYGMCAGFAREVLRLDGLMSVTLAVVAGRLVLLSAKLLFIMPLASMPQYFVQSLVPGLPAAAAQIILLPAVASIWLSSVSGRKQ